MKLFTSWIFKGWIVCLLLVLNAKMGESRPMCKDKQYVKDSICCDKCGPGTRLFADCTDTKQTVCVPCNPDEYQPGWITTTSCLPQQYCDPGKGFDQRTPNLVAEERCPCRQNFKCPHINCEYCEFTCRQGYGPETVNGKKTCLPCKKGFFSNEDSADQCKQWTNCKAQGSTESHPGSAYADVVCGPPVPGAAPSWVIVSVLCVITVLCLLILLLFCYKDKMKLLSVNLRLCVQNLKRTTIQQETLAPLYHSGGLPGGSKCMPCETTKLVSQVPLTPTDEPLCPFPAPIKVTLPLTVEMIETEGTVDKAASEDLSEGSGEPEEVSEDEEPVTATFSCGCVLPVQEPLEVGENEDCSQAVNPGTLGTCSCGLDGEERKKEIDSGTHFAPSNPIHFLAAIPPTEVHPSSPELCLPLSHADTKLDYKPQIKLEDAYKLKCIDSTSIDSNASPSVASAGTSVGPLMTSSFAGDLFQDKPLSESSSQGLSCEESRENKLSSGESDLECPPESLQSQLVEPTLTSGQVSGNHNTTFISSGQVMNFSGDVIVVYVSQTSVGGKEAGQDNAFGSPVQEQASETDLLFQRSLTEDSITQSTLQEQTLPIQEMMDERSPEKRKGTK